MKKSITIVIAVFAVLLTVAGSSSAWQGRMEGMGNPYGLIQDESDFLVHPALITMGKGLKVYSHYDFTYTDVLDWEYDIKGSTITK